MADLVPKEVALGKWEQGGSNTIGIGRLDMRRAFRNGWEAAEQYLADETPSRWIGFQPVQLGILKEVLHAAYVGAQPQLTESKKCEAESLSVEIGFILNPAPPTPGERANEALQLYYATAPYQAWHNDYHTGTKLRDAIAATIRADREAMKAKNDG